MRRHAPWFLAVKSHKVLYLKWISGCARGGAGLCGKSKFGPAGKGVQPETVAIPLDRPGLF